MNNSIPLRILLALLGGAAIYGAWTIAQSEIANNYAWGMTVSPALANVLRVFGYGLIGFPVAIAAAPKYRSLWGFYIATMLLAACASYSVNIDTQADQKTASGSQHRSRAVAEKKAGAIQARLEGNLEKGDAQTLAEREADAKAEAERSAAAEKKPCQRSYSDRCTEAKASTQASKAKLDDIRTHLSDARSRDADRIALKAAEAERDSIHDTREKEPATALTALIALLQLGASFIAKIGMGLIVDAFNGPAASRKPKKERRDEPPTNGGEKLPLAEVIRLHPEHRQIGAFIRQSTVECAGGEAPCGAMLQAYRRKHKQSKISRDDFVAVLRKLHKGAVKPKNSGHILVGRKVRDTERQSEPRKAVK